MADLPGRIDGLDIQRLIARGGAASVYEASDTRHARKVAVKVLDTRDVEDTKRRAFRRELHAMGRLGDHPYVVDVYDSGFTEDGAPYLVMPLIDTGTVADRIKRGEQFEIDEILDLAVKLASALETAHRRGILHCDIKPSNVFLGQFDTPMLGDLGISSVSDSGITETNSVSLTIRYAAPEVIEESPHTVRSDIYSLGATLFAMIELEPPFVSESKTAMVSKILGASSPPDLERSVPTELAAIVRDMMAIDPDARPSSAAAVVTRLQQLQTQRTGSPTLATISDHDEDDAVGVDEQSLVAPAATPKRRRPWKLIGAAAALVALIAGGIWFAPGGDDRDDAPLAAAAPEVTATVAAAAPADAVTETADPTAIPEPTATDEPEPTARPTPQPTARPTPQPTTPQPTTLPTVEPTTLPAAAGAESTDSTPQDESPDDEVAGIVIEAATISGVVVDQSGRPLETVSVDLFGAVDGAPRGDFLEGYETDPDGSFRFGPSPGCYVLTFVAPEGSVVEQGGKFQNVPVCVDDASSEVRVDRIMTPELVTDAQVAGRISYAVSGASVSDVHVDVFITAEDGSRGDFVQGTDTAADGTYVVEVVEGCYRVTVVAPEGSTLVGGNEFLNSPDLCVASGQAAVFDAAVG